MIARIKQRRLVTCCAVLAVISFGWSPALPAQEASEYQVKAAYLYHFLNFVDWPSFAFDGAEPVNICVVGNDPFGNDLDEIVRDKRVGGRGVQVRRFTGTAAGKKCHILFIADSESNRVGSILETVAGTPVLTVADLAGFETRGGMIRFVVEHDNVRLRINPDSATAAGLLISAKLLSVSTVVHARKGGQR